MRTLKSSFQLRVLNTVGVYCIIIHGVYMCVYMT